MNILVKIFSSAFGLGYFPKAPGTAGSLLGVLIFYFCRTLSFPTYLVLTLCVTLIAFISSHLAEKVYGQKDCQKIVIDEVAGQMVTYLFLFALAISGDHPPSLTLLRTGVGSPLQIVLGFILFRFFDVMKIFPANWAQDHIPGGVGVVADDLVAGVQAGIVFILLWSGLLLLFPSF